PSPSENKALVALAKDSFGITATLLDRVTAEHPKLAPAFTMALLYKLGGDDIPDGLRGADDLAAALRSLRASAHSNLNARVALKVFYEMFTAAEKRDWTGASLGAIADPVWQSKLGPKEGPDPGFRISSRYLTATRETVIEKKGLAWE